ncbi:ABC transporter ATP-binding protein [Deinococcus detaillensis]|uniref:ABC transporter ATP-binding protein n=1 Tax=Deinococcus detaillensis TaxID=2592048 RepID=A0A553V2Q1_9DEIO|nr:ABC transporter ATP-binding protein [Deinococcus detaillensis]TSA86758.1 ABC transporter ATP-binding protein [Deinococcus detaillensis]
MTLAIQTEQLRKEYKGRAVVQSLDLEVGEGEVFGFLGPNGAGKSTTVKMLLGLVRPTSGSIKVLGGSPDDPAVRARLGFLPEQFRFQTWMTAEEFLKFHGQLAGLKAEELRTRIPAVLKRVGLGGRGTEALGGYSKGMLQRAGLAGAILARPRLVFLDEPTSALDPVGRVEVREIIQELRGEGVAVFLNSHLLSEVEQVSDRVAFVKAGVVVRAGTMTELLGGALPVLVKVDHLSPELAAALGRLGQLEHQTEQQVSVVVSGEEAIPAIAQAVFASGAQLYALTPQRHDLEDLFLELVGQNGDTGQQIQLGHLKTEKVA